MDYALLAVLLTEARSAAQELRDIRKPIMLSPGHLHSLAQCLLDLTDTCQHLHRQSSRAWSCHPAYVCSCSYAVVPEARSHWR
jgi:hypothetical protein